MRVTSGTVTLQKDSQNLIGISIGGGAPYCPCVYVVQIFDNTPASKDGTLAADQAEGVREILLDEMQQYSDLKVDVACGDLPDDEGRAEGELVRRVTDEALPDLVGEQLVADVREVTDLK